MRFLWITMLVSVLFALSSRLATADYKIGERLPKKQLQAQQPKTAKAYQEVEWEALLPKGWDFTKGLDALDFDKLQDNDPKAIEALENLRKEWDKSPIEPSMDGKRIRISGFVVPLERSRDKISEFLLVPYFGACIHVPPPPANQIIHVTTDQAISEKAAMDDVWVSGVLHTEPVQTEMGQSGYRMHADSVKPFRAPKKAQIMLDVGGMVKRLPH